MAVFPTGAVHRPVNNFVWDVATMSWVMETQAAGGGGGAVTIADGADVAEGATTDAAVITDTTGTVSGKLRGLVKWAYERMPVSLGQKTMAASFPVVIASDQSVISVSATSLPLPTGAATEAKQTDGTQKSIVRGGAKGATAAADVTSTAGGANHQSLDTGIYDASGAYAGAGATVVPASTAAISADPALVVAISPNNVPSITIEGDSGIGPVAVKAASTAAVAADKALVVAISPNNTPVLPSGAATEAKQTQPGVDIGDVTVNNAAGASAVNVQDGGNSITVDGTVTVTPTTSNIVSIASSESVAAPTAAVWYLKRRWALPAAAIATPLSAWAMVTTAGSRTIVAIISDLGNLNLSTNVFTANNSVASPYFYGRLFGVVTTVMSATADTITPTYTDELGNSQATAGVVFASASPVGNAYEFPLVAAAGPQLDAGVRAVTAATDSAAPTGVVTFFGVNVLLETNGVANAVDMAVLNAGQLNANEEIAIFQIQAATTAQQRGAGITLALR